MNTNQSDVLKKAVGSHDANAGLFADRYAAMEKNPYADAFAYGRKKFFEFLFPYLEQRLKPGASVLEVGAGTGYLLEQLTKRGYQMTAVEPAPGMRQRAQQRNPEATIVDAKVGQLPFPDNSFDAVIAIEVFRYLHPNDIEAGYRECLRVLKPGGVLVATLVNKYALDGFALLYGARLLREKIGGTPLPNYCNFVTPGSIRRLFAKTFAVPVTTRAMLFSPLRLSYKVPGIGGPIAKLFEPFDNWLSQRSWWHPFAGHLVALAEKPYESTEQS